MAEDYKTLSRALNITSRLNDVLCPPPAVGAAFARNVLPRIHSTISKSCDKTKCAEGQAGTPAQRLTDCYAMLPPEAKSTNFLLLRLFSPASLLQVSEPKASGSNLQIFLSVLFSLFPAKTIRFLGSLRESVSGCERVRLVDRLIINSKPKKEKTKEKSSCL